MATVDAWLQPSASLGTAYSAAWISGTALRISIQNGTGATAETGSLRFNISASADIRVATNNSVPAQGVTPAATGTFFFVAGKICRLHGHSWFVFNVIRVACIVCTYSSCHQCSTVQ